MTTLEKMNCLTPTWHGPHDWWWTDSGGGHMLGGEPDETDRRVERGLIQYTCPGKAGTDADGAVVPAILPFEADSESMIVGYNGGVTVGRKQMIKEVYDRLIETHYAVTFDGLDDVGCVLCGRKQCDALEPLRGLLAEADISIEEYL